MYKFVKYMYKLVMSRAQLDKSFAYLFTDPERVYSLSERQVCQFYAELLLRPVDRFNYEEFMDCWKQSVPDGMNTSMDYLRVTEQCIVRL